MPTHLALQNLALALPQKRHFGGDGERARGEDFGSSPSSPLSSGVFTSRAAADTTVI